MKDVAVVARRIVRAIIRDLSDRRGLRHEWDQIDDEIRAEIRAEWQRLIEVELERATGDTD